MFSQQQGYQERILRVPIDGSSPAIELAATRVELSHALVALELSTDGSEVSFVEAEFDDHTPLRNYLSSVRADGSQASVPQPDLGQAVRSEHGAREGARREELQELPADAHRQPGEVPVARIATDQPAGEDQTRGKAGSYNAQPDPKEACHEAAP